MEIGLDLFRATIPLHSVPSNYCTISDWPDICICGNLISPNGMSLRNHCPDCKGMHSGFGYEIQILNVEFGIHYSWIEMAFASALKILRSQ
jgi:hypothetical protein